MCSLSVFIQDYKQSRKDLNFRFILDMKFSLPNNPDGKYLSDCMNKTF